MACRKAGLSFLTPGDPVVPLPSACSLTRQRRSPTPERSLGATAQAELATKAVIPLGSRASSINEGGMKDQIPDSRAGLGADRSQYNHQTVNQVKSRGQTSTAARHNAGQTPRNGKSSVQSASETRKTNCERMSQPLEYQWPNTELVVVVVCRGCLLLSLWLWSCLCFVLLCLCVCVCVCVVVVVVVVCCCRCVVVVFFSSFCCVCVCVCVVVVVVCCCGCGCGCFSMCLLL